MNDSSEAARRTLNVPPCEHAHYARNFISLAVCELRFPTMLAYEERAPQAFADATRREYPIYERLTNVQIDGAGVAQNTGHAFRSRDRRWTATVRSAAITLETAKYGSFEEFQTRLDKLLKAAKSTVQSDFFTRVGLRFINAIPCEFSEVGDWINPDLVRSLAAGVYGDVDEYWQRVRGLTKDGGYSFMHGLPAASGPARQSREYVLDFDFFQENVDVVDTLATVEQLHHELFCMFRWALGASARKHLGDSLLKG